MLSNKLIKLASELSSFNDAFRNKKCRIVDKSIYSSNFLFFYFFYWSSDFYSNPYRSLLIDFFSKAEKNFPGSSYFVSDKLCKLIYGNIPNKEKVLTDKTYDSTMNYLKSITNDEAFNVFEKIMIFSGSDATISCEKSKNSDIEVSKICLPTFDFKIDDSFKNVYFKSVNKTTKDFIISVVDGFIERESELYSLIEHAKQSKLPVILICRGLSDSAKQNLKQIILKNSIYFYPYVEKYNNEDPFKLKDFCSLIDTKTVSGEYSDSVNEVIVEKSRVLRCTISNDSITLFETNKLLIKELNESIKEKSRHQDLMQYLQKRKIRCSPNNTIVKIPERKITLLNDIKSLIVCFNHCATKGVYTNSKNVLNSIQCKKISDLYSENLYKNLTNISYKIKIGE
jgi:hypothetical protein